MRTLQANSGEQTKTSNRLGPRLGNRPQPGTLTFFDSDSRAGYADCCRTLFYGTRLFPPSIWCPMRRSTNRISPVAAMESRQLLAGNVTLSFDGATLQLVGDNSANQIQVSWSAEGLRVQAQTGTRLNGVTNGLLTIAMPSSIAIDLKGANDQLTLAGYLGGQISIQMGSGNDSVRGNSVVCENVFSVDLGSGNDNLRIEGTTVSPNQFGGNLTCNGNTGNDVMKFYESVVYGSLQALGGTGNDGFGGTRQLIHGTTSVDLGTGNDLLGFFQWQCRSAANILGNTGDDIVALHESRFLTSVTIQLGEGRDGLLSYQNQFEAGVTRNGGNANDVLYRSGDSVTGLDTVISFENQATTLTTQVNSLYTRLNSVFSL